MALNLGRMDPAIFRILARIALRAVDGY